MNIGDIIINKGGDRFKISKFITVSNEQGVLLKPLNKNRSEFRMLKVYLDHFINSGIYIKKPKPKKRKRLKLRKRKNDTVSANH